MNMTFDELSERYGPVTAERISQALTLQEFSDLEIDELAAYFELRAERLYQEYRRHKENPALHNKRDEEIPEYLEVMQRRWQQAEELAHAILSADLAAREEKEAARAS